MLRLLDLARPDVLAYHVSDVLTEEDVQVVTRAFDDVLAAHPTVHLYAEVEGLRGFEARALWLDLVYGLRHVGALHQLGRVALVTDADWIRRLAQLEARLLPVGQLRIYEPDGRDDARAWVRAAPPAGGLPEQAPSVIDELDDWIARGGLDVAWDNVAWDDAVWADGGGPLPTADELPPARAPRFGHTVHRTHVLLRAVADRLGTPGTAPAYHALRAVLHALRDRLPDAEAADLAAQLTTLVRGVFYEGYHPARTPTSAGREAFLEAVRAELEGGPLDAEAAVRAVGDALADTVSPGEWTQVLGVLPADVRALFEAPVPA